jgi:dTDP-3-amino-3,4,6-trideoxy-alpha-D-glucose transaminase
MPDHIPFLDVRPQEDANAVNSAIKRVIDSGRFILGPEVQAFEQEFSEASALKHAVGVGNGTDALSLLLEGLGIGPGDEVITSALSAGFTAIAIIRSGATPVFVDIDEHRLTLDPAAVRSAITTRTAAIIPVHLYGQAADLTALSQLAAQHNLALIEDCCQAHLATYQGRAVGTFGHGCAFSFYPTKNLGALGDGGAACTNDAGLAERIRSLRNGGMSKTSYHEHTGINSRLDELHAAVLRAKLPFLSEWTTKRRRLAARYREQLCGQTVTLLPEIDPGHVYHLFPIKTTQRESLREHLGSLGIDTVVHYPTPLPEQPAFKRDAAGVYPIAEQICGEIVSLPLHPALPDESIDRVIQSVTDFAR